MHLPSISSIDLEFKKLYSSVSRAELEKVSPIHFLSGVSLNLGVFFCFVYL